MTYNMQRGKAKHSQNNAKIEILRRKKEYIIYCQMEILEMKNTTTNIKIYVDGLNSKLEIIT